MPKIDGTCQLACGCRPIWATATLLMVSVAAHAVPIQLSSAQFAADVSGLTAAVETFEGIPSNTQGNPFPFANGSITSSEATNDLVVVDSPTFCGTLADSCLTGRSVIDDVRTITGLPPGTTHWSADLYFIWPTDNISITVTGGSGLLTIATTGASLDDFVGFADTLGLTSVVFVNAGTPGVGRANYSFDNITTASVPEPTTLGLLGAGLLAAVLVRWRTRLAP